jgi:Transposase DDE domain group 1
VTGLPSNAGFQALAREVVAPAPRAYAARGPKGTRCHSTRSQAGTWSRSRRVVSKVEVSDQGVNPRVVVTALEQARTKVRYQHIDGARGQAENDSKEHKQDGQSERTSCQRCEANQWRVVLQAAAAMLRETLRREVVRSTQGASATMETIQ